jgi:uncharacterized membrane protein YfcA
VWPDFSRVALGFVTNFFDTLGIGSFASTTAFLKLRRMTADENIPGILNVGHTLPVVIQALIFVSAVSVGSLTLVAMATAAVLGAWLGAGVVSRLSRPAIQLGMGIALAVAAAMLLLVNFHLLPGGGDALQLEGWKLAVAVATIFILAALSTLGVGMYAPCLILVSLLGMNPIAAFPIMMGSAALLMPFAGMRFVRTGRYDMRVSLGLLVGGIPAVLIAGLWVRALPLEWLRWLVVCVVIYAAVAMLRSGGFTDERRESRT